MKHFLLLFVLGSCLGEARTWTDVQGRTIEGNIVDASEKEVTVDRAGKEVVIPLSRLSEEDQEFVREWLEDKGDAKPVAVAASGPLMFDGKPLKAGGVMNLFTYDYSEEHLVRVEKKHKAKDTGYKMAIAVPEGFDPSKPQRIFVVSAPVNNDQQRTSGNIGAFGSYAASCVANGWICFAYDTNIGRSNHNSDLLLSFDKLKQVWPDIVHWQFAVGGFSGGAKGCFDPCAFYLDQKLNVTGAFLGGCNEDRSGNAKDRYNTTSSAFRSLKVFTSTGTKDNLVSKSQAEAVSASLKKNGMRNQRNEFFEGGHQIHQPHFDAALKWFAEAAEK